MASTTQPPHSPLEGLTVRRATTADTTALSDAFFTSFTPSHKFWQYLMPDTAANRAWWVEAWRLGIEEDPTTVTFAVVDPAAGDKVVAFSRWVYPQGDGNLSRLWPELPSSWDPEVSGAFFAGMEENRKELMGSKQHWFLEMLGVDQSYQRRGIANSLVEWGCKQADEQGMETYLDASMKGLPLYKKYFGFAPARLIPIPDREEFGSFVYTSVVRPAGAKPSA